MDNLCEIFKKCWATIIDQRRLRNEEFIFFSESDIHHALVSSLKRENVRHVHVEFPLPLESIKLWTQIKNFGKVSFQKGYYRADVCILHEEKPTPPRVLYPRLISEIRWMPALIPPFQLLDKQDEKVQFSIEKLTRTRERYNKSIPKWYSNRLLRNLEKFFDVLKKYQDYQIEGYLCVIDELCPSIDKQLSEKIKGLNPPSNFHLCVNYIN